jgi:opacity protein-like surface antigen
LVRRLLYSRCDHTHHGVDHAQGCHFAFKVSGGYAFYDSATTSRLGSSSERETDNGKDLAYGIGIDLTISGGLKFRAEYELVDVSEGDFQIVSAGAVYEF